MHDVGFICTVVRLQENTTQKIEVNVFSVYLYALDIYNALLRPKAQKITRVIMYLIPPFKCNKKTRLFQIQFYSLYYITVLLSK